MSQKFWASIEETLYFLITNPEILKVELIIYLNKIPFIFLKIYLEVLYEMVYFYLFEKHPSFSNTRFKRIVHDDEISHRPDGMSSVLQKSYFHILLLLVEHSGYIRHDLMFFDRK